MTPREKRERLFRKSRPFIRPMEFFEGPNYHKDIKILWVAHKHSPFYGLDPNISEKDFADVIVNLDRDIYIAEDDNKQFSGQGPIAIILISGNGWKIEPHANFFPWATKRNMLRSAVAFLQWARSTRKIGCVITFVLEEGKNLYDRVCEYGVLHYVGKIKNGDPRGDEYVYTVKGKKQ